MTAETTINKKFWEVQEPFFKRVLGRRRQKLAVDFGAVALLTFFEKYDICYTSISLFSAANIQIEHTKYNEKIFYSIR